jgi:CTP:phosphocholine cytidylyltransferase-like protein
MLGMTIFWLVILQYFQSQSAQNLSKSISAKSIKVNQRKVYQSQSAQSLSKSISAKSIKVNQRKIYQSQSAQSLSKSISAKSIRALGRGARSPHNPRHEREARAYYANGGAA